MDKASRDDWPDALEGSLMIMLLVALGMMAFGHHRDEPAGDLYWIVLAGVSAQGRDIGLIGQADPVGLIGREA